MRRAPQGGRVTELRRDHVDFYHGHHGPAPDGRPAAAETQGGHLPADRPAGAGGRVPPRPALAVKVENLPQARPQYGLSAADVVYEEPVEGGITRFIVIYQCHDAGRIEPVRSGRLIDPDIVRQYGAHPLFAYAGAIQPVVDKVDSSSLVDVGIYRAPLSAYWRDPDRYAPHNLISDTAVLYAAGAAQHAPPTPPPPVFHYGALPAHSAADERQHQLLVLRPHLDLAARAGGVGCAPTWVPVPPPWVRAATSRRPTWWS